MNKFSRGIRFLLCVVHIYSKYAWVIPSKDEKGITITNAFQKILDESNHKLNTIRLEKGNEFYKRPMKLWIDKNAIEMYSTHSEEKSVVVERFIRTLQNKDYKYIMTSFSGKYL